jgi:dihydropteroate synthase
MIEAAKEANVDVVVMHNLGIPADPKVVIAEEEDVVAVVFHWAQEKIQSLTEQGIHKDRVIFDPGIGFGKSTEQSLLLIRNIERFKELGVRLFVGHSRKSFLKPFLKAVDEAERDRLTAEISSYLSAKGIDYIRVHNVTLNKQRLGEAPSLPEGFL